jgi:hypothetical protein
VLLRNPWGQTLLLPIEELQDWMKYYVFA